MYRITAENQRVVLTRNTPLPPPPKKKFHLLAGSYQRHKMWPRVAVVEAASVVARARKRKDSPHRNIDMCSFSEQERACYDGEVYRFLAEMVSA